jgi:hypothetical protein
MGCRVGSPPPNRTVQKSTISSCSPRRLFVSPLSSQIKPLGRFEEADPERAEGANATRKSKQI